MDRIMSDKARKLEKGLLRSLIDHRDSAQRQRYVKKWIYGDYPTPNQDDLQSKQTQKHKGLGFLWAILGA